jgi:hypothetical protein
MLTATFERLPNCQAISQHMIAAHEETENVRKDCERYPHI